MPTKYIFITGGVASSLGKGITAASIAFLLKQCGFCVTIQKFDPYVNIDPGTLNSNQHGEIFITADGAETDLDLGHYERFLDQNLSQQHNITTGRIYHSVINKERNGFYQGQTVQIIPHITDEIKNSLITSFYDIVVVEIGGTVGDIESLPFLEAIRQMKKNKRHVCYIHVTLVPYLKIPGEFKTKPTQHSVKELRSIGIQPDIIICRSEHHLPLEVKNKIALFCDVRPEEVIENIDRPDIYDVPRYLHMQNIVRLILTKLNLPYAPPDLAEWNKLTRPADIRLPIFIAGPTSSDACLSVIEALKHAGLHLGIEVVQAPIEKAYGILLLECDKHSARSIIHTAQKNRIPFFAISSGYRLVVEESLGILGSSAPIKGAHETELIENTKTYNIYGKKFIMERYRTDFSPDPFLFNKKKNLVPSAIRDGKVAGVELKNHPWFIAVNYHPEFISRPLRPHPLFMSFLSEAQKLQACSRDTPYTLSAEKAILAALQQP